MNDVPWLRIPGMLVLWVGMLAIKFVVFLMGLVAIPFMWKYSAIDYNNLPNWARLWSNIEDWQGQPNHWGNSLPRWWVDSRGAKFWSFFKYHALRNPANGLRAIDPFGLSIEENKVCYVSTYETFADAESSGNYEPGRMRRKGRRVSAYFAWQGWKAGMDFVYIWSADRHMSIKIGWRVNPEHVNFIEVSMANRAYQRIKLLRENVSFASKVLLWRRG